MTHFIEQCKECKKVIGQCRCPDKNKEIVYSTCDDCMKAKPTPTQDTHKNCISKSEVEKKLSGMSLSKKQSTKIFGNILRGYQKMKDGWKYKAPELIEAELKEFIWDIYVMGRIAEKGDVTTLLKK